MKLYDFIKTEDDKNIYMIMQIGVRKIFVEKWEHETINENEFKEMTGKKPEIIPVKPSGVYTWLHLGYTKRLHQNGFGLQLVSMRLHP